MIIQDIYINQYDWKSTIYYNVNKSDCNIIIEHLFDICDDNDIFETIDFLRNITDNNGITYSNILKKKSIIVISNTSSALEFQDTYDHEKCHLAAHISTRYSIDPFSEEFAYLVGEIGRQMYPVSKLFMCDHCRGTM